MTVTVTVTVTDQLEVLTCYQTFPLIQDMSNMGPAASQNLEAKLWADLGFCQEGGSGLEIFCAALVARSMLGTGINLRIFLQ